MNGIYRISGPTRRDIDNIWDFYNRESGETTADQQLARLQERFRLLSDQPYLGVSRPEYAADLRSHAVPNTRYVIFYFPREYGVDIARVIHASQNIIRHFLDLHHPPP